MKKILVIEDDQVVRSVYQRFLQTHGFEVEVAADGLSGLERAAEFQPDAVLLDLMMPKVGGIDVLRNLRADETFRELPVIVLTNACVPAFIEQAHAAGANYVFDKSKDSPVAVLAALQALLNIVPERHVAATP